MEVSDEDGLWRLTDHHIENRKTGEKRHVKDMPPASALAFMPYDVFIRKCAETFATGVWPPTRWKSGNISY